MSLIYALRVKWVERSAHVGSLLITLISLAIGFLFILLFVSKFLAIHADIQHYHRIFKQDDLVRLCIKGDSETVSVEKSVLHRGYVYLLWGEEKLKLDAVSIDKYYAEFFEISMGREVLSEFFAEKDRVLLHASIARKWKVAEGDSFTIEGKKYYVLAILSDPQFKDRIIFSEPGEQVRLDPSKEELFIRTQDADLIDPADIISSEAMKEAVGKEIKSLRDFQRFIGAFALFFSGIAVLNIFLVLVTRITIDQRNNAIKGLCGETSFINVIQTTMDTVVLVILSYHLSLLVYFLVMPTVPDFFYFSLSIPVYLICLFFLVVIGVLFSLSISLWRKHPSPLSMMRG